MLVFIQALGACSDTARVRIAERSLHTSRPRQAQCAESLDIHLRIGARGVMALVSQQLPDLRQGRAGSEKLGGKAVSEDMSPVVGDSHGRRRAPERSWRSS